MGTSIGIDEIDDIERMSEVMRCRGLSLGGLQTLDQMKQRAKKALRISEKVRMIRAAHLKFLARKNFCPRLVA